MCRASPFRTVEALWDIWVSGGPRDLEAARALRRLPVEELPTLNSLRRLLIDGEDELLQLGAAGDVVGVRGAETTADDADLVQLLLALSLVEHGLDTFSHSAMSSAGRKRKWQDLADEAGLPVETMHRILRWWPRLRNTLNYAHKV